MSSYALELVDIVKQFPARDGNGVATALAKINLQVKHGEFVCLLGPSGCGKTTALRCMAGFEPPTSGQVLLNGQNVTDVAAHKRGMPLVFQNYALFPHLSVFENIAYGLRRQKVSNADVERRVQKTMAQLGLDALGARQPEQLSGGQQQRVALARALVLEPSILLFDEPLCNLDAKLREHTRIEIKKLQEEMKITCVYVTHDQEEAMSLADRIVIMNHGVIAQSGTPEEVYTQPSNRFVADFIGRTNFVSGEVISIDNNNIAVQALGSVCQAVTPTQHTLQVGDHVDLVIRYESLIPATGDSGQLQGKVTHFMYLGERALYEVTVHNQQLFMQVADPQSHSPLAVSTDVAINFGHGITAIPSETVVANGETTSKVAV